MMRRIVIEIEYENENVSAKDIGGSTEVFKTDHGRLMLVPLPELDPNNDIQFKDIYEPRHAAA